LRAGAVESVTSILSFVGQSGGLSAWHGAAGITAGVNAGLSIGEAYWTNAAAQGDATAWTDVLDRSLKAARIQYEAATRAAADRGTIMHDAIESYLFSGRAPSVADPAISAAASAAKAEIAAFVPGAAFERLLLYRGKPKPKDITVGFGGTADVIAGPVLIDWKTCERRNDGKYRLPTAKECAQLAAYRLAGAATGLCDADAECRNVYFDRNTGEIVRRRVWSPIELKHGLALFLLAYKVKRELECLEL